MKTTIIAFTAAALAATVAVAPAHAGELRVEVAHGDLDIQTVAGAQALASRIEATAGVTCARGGDIRNLKLTSVCKQALITEAVDQLNGQGAAQVASALAARS